MRAPVLRPDSAAPPTFVCRGCELLLDDGVVYAFCPACDGPVDRIERPAAPPTREASTTLSRIRRTALGTGGLALLGAAAIALLMTLALAPSWRTLALALFAPLLLAPVVLGGVVVSSVGAALGELRALARDRRTRVIHGLEHATAHLLTRDGYRVLAGQTSDWKFELHVEASAGCARARLPSSRHVRRVVAAAARRILDGDTALALHPSCGTSAMVAIVFVSLLVLAAAGVGLVAHLTPTVVVAIIGAAVVLLTLAVRPLGLLVQRRFTVSTRFVSARAHGVARRASTVAGSGDDTICIEARVDVR